MLGPEEAPAEIVDRFTCKARQFSRPFPVCVQEVSHDAQRAGSACRRGGQRSMTAQIPAPVARPQPSRRSGIAEFGAGIVTGSTNVRSAPVAPAAK